MNRWETCASATTQHGYTCMTENGPLVVRAVIKSFAPSIAAAQLCSEVIFRWYLDQAGIPWRTLSADGEDEGTGQDDQPDPR